MLQLIRLMRVLRVSDATQIYDKVRRLPDEDLMNYSYFQYHKQLGNWVCVQRPSDDGTSKASFIVSELLAIIEEFRSLR